MVLRKMVLLQPEGESDRLRDAIRSAGWETYITPDATRARELAEQQGLNVGVISVNERFLNGAREQVETLLQQTSHVEWVGLLKPPLVDDDRARELIAEYFYDYHTLPVDTRRLLDALGHAHGMASISQSITNPVPETVNGYQMIGASRAMRQVFRNIDKVAGVDAPVMITGESGTGKELAAIAVHNESGRADGPFLAVNCGALPGELIQTELFGHEKGAYTGAHQRKIGRIEAANGGTIFLDEIGDLSLSLQVNLLRFLQENTIERVGGTETIPVDVRVITATHKDLQAGVKQGSFRDDLFYRLNVLSLELPPLRERDADIEQLAQFYFHKFASERNHYVKGFSRRAIQLLRSYEWPGNVRELINRVRRAIVMCERNLIAPSDLGFERRKLERHCVTLAQAKAEAESQAIQTALRFSGNNVSEAARNLGVARVTLYRMMEKYELMPRETNTKKIAPRAPEPAVT